MWNMYNRMKLPYFGLNVRLLLTDLFRIWFRRCLFRFRIGSGSGQKFRVLPANSGVLKAVAPSKNLEKSTFMCFANKMHKITSHANRISSALVFLCTDANLCPNFLALSLFIVFWSFYRCFENYYYRKCAKNIAINLLKGRDQWEMRGVAKMANDQSIFGTVVIDVLLSFNLAAILY